MTYHNDVTRLVEGFKWNERRDRECTISLATKLGMSASVFAYRGRGGRSLIFFLSFVDSVVQSGPLAV